MASREPQHRRIRFRRDEIADLDALPSARRVETGATSALRRPGRRRRGRRLIFGASIALFIFFGLAAALYALSVSGIAQEQMRAAAERAIEKIAGRDIAVRLGTARISVDGTHLIGLEVDDVGLRADGEVKEFAEVASMRFGVDLLSLLSGHIVPTATRITEVRVTPSAYVAQARWDMLARLRGPSDLLDPDRLPPLVFDAVRSVFGALGRGGANAIELQNVTVASPDDNGALVILDTARLSLDTPGSLTVEMRGTAADRTWKVEGQASRTVTGEISEVRLALATEPASGVKQASVQVGPLALQLRGREGAPSRLEFMVEAARLDVLLDANAANQSFSGSASLTAAVTQGQGRVEIGKLAIASGGSGFDVAGVVAPVPADTTGQARYRYELGGDDLVLAASDATEPPLHFKGRVSGAFDPQNRRLVADAISATTSTSSASAKAALQFAEAKTPGVDFSLRTKAMPVAEAKQLWPWFTGKGARAWTQQHLRNGTLSAGALEYHVLPGRIGSGVPATPEELQGTFTVAETSFDLAGALPPVSKATGTVSINGADAEVVLEQAEIQTASGRGILVGNTSLKLRATNVPPLIAKLDGEVSGDAAALAEFVALDPLNAMARVPFTAGDLSGIVTAQVRADIPLQKSIPRERLDWLVIADFRDLALAKQLDGQQLSKASGTLSAEPSSVQIDATAELSGFPAKLAIVEPLKPDGPERKRSIEVKLDDEARAARAPGLNGMIQGPVVLKVDAATDERKVSADLSAARLELPWIGWSKGVGVPASADFSFLTSEGETDVSALEISGQSFSVTGKAVLVDGGLKSARLDRVRLNRGDALEANIDRKGDGYSVSIRGSTLDGRALVKAVTSAAKAQSASRPSPRGPTLSLQAEVASVSGFGGEALKDFALSLDQKGSGRSLVVSAKTDRGATIAMQDDTKGGTRSVSMKSADAGSVLRFFNVYPNMQGGAIQVTLGSTGGGPLNGNVSAANFVLVNEPRLASLVSSKPDGADRSLGDAVKRKIDTTRVTFDRASASIVKGSDFLSVEDGVIRSAAIGSTFQGTLYDAQGHMDMTGTFMPAYGLNRLFGELPLIGVILGNGNDRGLLGVTFKLEGNAKSPVVTVNPLSLIAPGIFRRIFEFSN